MSPGERIKAERTARGWSQEELAYKAGLSYRTIFAAESTDVRPKTLRKIATAFGWEETALLEEVAS